MSIRQKMADKLLTVAKYDEDLDTLQRAIDGKALSPDDMGAIARMVQDTDLDRDMRDMYYRMMTSPRITSLTHAMNERRLGV